jgi:acyl-CoA thioester hydrolase
MRHRYECPMRWADLDVLGHVNNVVYVDYLQEARVDMMRTHAPDSRSDDLAEGVVVVRSEVSYRAPLTFRFRPVSIECWVTMLRAASFTMSYEVFDEDDQGRRTTYLLAKTVLAPYVFGSERPRRLTGDEREALSSFLEPDESPDRVQPVANTRGVAQHYPVQVRFSDVDVYGHVNTVKYFEYFQEGRIALLAHLLRDAGPAAQQPQLVVAQTDVDYRTPILFRSEPYDMWSRVAHLGTTSLQIEAEIRDTETVLSRSRVTVVLWDPVSGGPTEPTSVQRQLLTRG